MDTKGSNRINDDEDDDITEPLNRHSFVTVIEKADSLKLDISSLAVFFVQANFIKFFLYHLLFYIMGPFIVLLIWAIDGLPLAYNMGFIGCNGLILFQYVLFVSLALMTAMVVLYDTDSQKSNDWDKYLEIGAQIFIRCMVVAIKYAYTSPLRIIELKKRRFPLDQITQEFILLSWVQQQPQPQIEEQLDATIWRLQIACNQWRVKFAERVPSYLEGRLYDRKYYVTNKYERDTEKKEQEQRCKDAQQVLQKRDQELVTIFNNQNRGGYCVASDKDYDARNLLREIIIAADLEQASLAYARMLFLGRLVCYYSLKVYSDLREGEIDMFKPHNIVITVCELILYLLIYRQNPGCECER